MIYSITFVIWWSSILLEVTTNNNYLPSASYWQSISHTINTENRIRFFPVVCNPPRGTSIDCLFLSQLVLRTGCNMNTDYVKQQGDFVDYISYKWPWYSFVVITMRGTFLVHDLSSGLKQEWREGWHSRNRKCISFRKTRIHPWFCSRVVLLNLYFYT
jgi:hypothetical protein